MFLGANTLECESCECSRGQFAPESSREWEGQRVKGPGSKSSRVRIGKGPLGRFFPGNELTRERKGCESLGSVVRVMVRVGLRLYVMILFCRNIALLSVFIYFILRIPHLYSALYTYPTYIIVFIRGVPENRTSPHITRNQDIEA